ncbi:uncharacterized protein LOC144147293 [Haemaphysalis longicornis]
MMLYTTAMAVRLIGMTFYATLSALEQMLEKESIVHHIELLELHREEIFGRFSVPVIFMTSVVDALFVYMLTRYEEHLRFQARGGAPVLEANDSSSPIASLGSVPSTENVANA